MPAGRAGGFEKSTGPGEKPPAQGQWFCYFLWLYDLVLIINILTVGRRETMGMS